MHISREQIIVIDAYLASRLFKVKMDGAISVNKLMLAREHIGYTELH